MCTIAGYAGNKQAAPILIEMIKKQEYFDGGLSTGIATIHNGKVYTAKVLGDSEELLRSTDAINLPGTVGIIHSRTGNNHITHAHPFTSDDEELALVLNGTLRFTGTEEMLAHERQVMNELSDRGIKIKSAIEPTDENYPLYLKNGMMFHDTEPFALIIGDKVSKVDNEHLREELVKATKETLEDFPQDIITVSVHARLDDTITIGTLNRPMAVGFGDGETFIASCPIAFPDDIQKNPVTFLPPTSVSQVTSEGLHIYTTKMEGVKVEEVDYRKAGIVYKRMEEQLKGQKDNPKSIYDMSLMEGIWKEPYIDCRYSKGEGFFKPICILLYEALYNFHKEGRLHSTLGLMKDNKTKITKFWIED